MNSRALALLRPERPEGQRYLPAYLFPVQFAVLRQRRATTAPPALEPRLALGLVVTRSEGVRLDEKVHLALEGQFDLGNRGGEEDLRRPPQPPGSLLEQPVYIVLKGQ